MLLSAKVPKILLETLAGKPFSGLSRMLLHSKKTCCIVKLHF